MKKIIAAILGMFFLLSLVGCSTIVHFDTDVPGATVYVDGRAIGVTPTVTKLSNAVWEDPDVVIKKEGYEICRSSVVREPKIGSIIAGCFFPPLPFLWCYGPKKYQFYVLTPKDNEI